MYLAELVKLYQPGARPMTIPANAVTAASVQKINPAQAARAQIASPPDSTESPFGKIVSDIARQANGAAASKS